MSWMDSWSRPSKSQATPPPYYLLPGGDRVPYCKACGRLIGDRKKLRASTSATPATPVKYCSARCRTNKRNKPLDLYIEDTFVALLNGSPLPTPPAFLGEEIIQKISLCMAPGAPGDVSKKSKKVKKGENRILVDCTEVESLIFGSNDDPEKRFGRKKNRRRRGVQERGEWKSVDMISDDEENRIGEMSYLKKLNEEGETESEDEEETETQAEAGAPVGGTKGSSAATLDPEILARLSIRSGTRIRPSQDKSEVNGGVGGEKGVKERRGETDDNLAKRRDGQQRADGRESVRCAARRGVAFGFVIAKRGEEGEDRRLCEAVMQGKVVESSFAKGEWGVRWRE